MPGASYEILRLRLTPARFAPYEQAANGNAALTLALYEWNMEAATAIFRDLGAFEVLLRNAIDLKLRARYQAATSAPPWYRQVVLRDKAMEARDVAIGRATAGGKPEDQDVVTAELSFGFWRYLLARTYQASLWPIILNAFSGKPGAVDRHGVEFRVDQLYYLRNRIAHHEPIFNRNLVRDHAFLLEVAGWICSDTRDWIEARSTVASVLAVNPTP